MTRIEIPADVREAIEAGALVALSMSGGKDSQAMASAVMRWLRSVGREGQAVAVHADLGRAEWSGTHEAVQAQCDALGVPLTVVQRSKGDLLERIEARAQQLAGQAKPFWPSASNRYCTSDLKRDPIDKWFRSLDASLIVSVEGLRAEESNARAKKSCSEPRKRIVTKSRQAITWRPILAWSESEVWAEIGGREGPNVHYAYRLGNERLSCSLCVLASEADLTRGALHNQEYANALADLEEWSGFSFRQGFSILELCERLDIRR